MHAPSAAALLLPTCMQPFDGQSMRLLRDRTPLGGQEVPGEWPVLHEGCGARGCGACKLLCKLN